MEVAKRLVRGLWTGLLVSIWFVGYVDIELVSNLEQKRSYMFLGVIMIVLLIISACTYLSLDKKEIKVGD